MSLFPILLFVHVLTAVAAFGPTYAFGISAGLAAQEPFHVPFNNRARQLVSRRLTIPGTIVMGVTGVAMIAVTGYPVMAQTSRWLLVSIVLYVAAILYTVLVTWRVQRQIAVVAGRLAAERAPTAPPAASGPPPELAALIHSVRRDGKAMGIVIVVIVFLMVVKPPFPL